jgi:hypothetical protein
MSAKLLNIFLLIKRKKMKNNGKTKIKYLANQKISIGSKKTNKNGEIHKKNQKLIEK